MSISSPPRPPRPPRQSGESSRDRGRRSAGKRPDSGATGLIGRLYASAKAPFRLSDGKGRLRVLLLAALFVFTLFGARLIDLQAIHADAMAAEARGSRTVTVTVPAERGTIYDSNGVALAQSIPARDVTVDPYEVKNPTDYAAKLSPIVGVSEAKILQALTPGTNAAGREVHFAYIARRVTLDGWNQINAMELPGIFSEPASKRVYPSQSLAGNLLGYTNFEGVGAAGLESAYNQQLAGVDGKKTFERSATGGEIPTGSGSETQETPGTSLHLSINRDLQWIAQQAITKRVKEIKADSAVVVAMEPATGRIVALAQAPTGNPNDANIKESDLRNHAIDQAFEPGSTSKVMTMAAVLNEGKADPSTVIRVPNQLLRGGTYFHDDVSHPLYKMTLAGVLAQSSNIGTIQAAEKIGGPKLYEYLQRFGVGQPSGLGLPGETTGYVPPPEKWSPTSFPTIAFGQGLSVNAIQAASVFATVANGGVRVTPQVIDSKTLPDGTTEQAPAPNSVRVVSDETAKTLITMMEEVVGKHGTAPMAAIDGYRVAGKTGTAFRYDDKKGRYDGYVASFIGLAPADDPKLVVAVISQNPKAEHFGGVTGGPVFKEVMSAALQMMKVPPSGTKAPELPLHAPGSTKGGPWNWDN